MKYTCPKKNRDTPLNRKRDLTGQAKDDENNTPPPMNWRPLLLEGNF